MVRRCVQIYVFACIRTGTPTFFLYIKASLHKSYIKPLHAGEGTITVQEHQWGDTFPQQDSNTAPPPFDIVAACDVMYIREAVPQLVSSLCKCVKRPHGIAFVAHGRNRNGESEFVAAVMEQGLCVRELNGSELDAVYQCVDVSVLELTWR
jgi:predicted nicotinamide N-methyase